MVLTLPYRLCAIDLDDTLLNHDQQISPRNMAAVKAVSDLGVTVALASGRMHEGILRYGREMGVIGPIISYNGAMVKDARADELWLHDEVPGDLAAIVLDYCREHALQLNYYRDGKVLSAAMTPWLELYEHRTKAPVEILADFYTALQGKPSTKLVIVDSPEKTDALKPTFEEIFGKRLYITKTSDEYLEFMSPRVNKGAALEMVARRLDIPQSETLAFGDSFNDIPMLLWAGLGLAVGNAKPAVKAAANRVVGSNEEDGVGVALEEIFRIHSNNP